MTGLLRRSTYHKYICIYTNLCVCVCIYIYIVYIYIYIPRGTTDLILISKTHNLYSTYLFINVTFMLTIIHDMQHIVGCPTWEHSHPNRCWVSKWEHGCLNRCSVSKMGTWLSKSMFDLSKMEHGFPNRCWISHMGT